MHTVKFTESQKEAVWDEKHASILELAESIGLNPPYSCRMGICTTCESKLVSGNITYNPEPENDPVTGNLFLCCSQPTSDVEIEI